MLKDEVYSNNPHTEDDLKKSIMTGSECVCYVINVFKPDFYLGGMLKDEVYSNKPHTEDDLKKSIMTGSECVCYVINVFKPKETISSTSFK
jgi:hypothetical protein